MDDHGVVSAWVHNVEIMASSEVISGILEEGLLLQHRIWCLDHVPDYVYAMEFVHHVEEFIPKFHAFSHLPQQSFLLAKFLELHKLLNLIDWEKCHVLREAYRTGQGRGGMVYEWECLRMSKLMKNIHAATTKTILQWSRLTQDNNGRVGVEQKMETLQDFVMA